MSVSIRLAKFGKRHAPSYRVVVTKTKTKRNGKFIAILGFYNPIDDTTKFTLDKVKYDEWVKKGAIVSEAVKKLVDGTYEYVKYDPKVVKAKEGEGSKNTGGDAPTEKADDLKAEKAKDEPVEEKDEEKVEKEAPKKKEKKEEEPKEESKDEAKKEAPADEKPSEEKEAPKKKV